MHIGLRTDHSGADRMLRSLHRDQLPFATSVAVNETAKKVQAAQRVEIQKNMKIRRPWVLQGVKMMQWAKKHRPTAIIGIDRQRDFLAKFEDGGVKRARDGGRIAIPQQARRTKADIVPKSARPRAFGFRLIGRGLKGELYEGSKRTFMIRSSDGEGGVFQRVGKSVRMLFSFAKQARIRPMLKFRQTARTVALRVFAGEFKAAFAKAIATARR